MSENRESLKIVVVGHVDHGKSTVIGRLLYDTNSVPEGKIERVKKTCKEKGKPFEYAYLLDAFEEEQKQGITIDTTQLQFFTEARDYVIIDAPGHKEFLKNMISGAANAEAALLIVDAHEGIQEQSKRHGYILSLLGIQKVYVVVNKMDLIDYSEDKFSEIQKELNEFLNGLHIYPLRYIPISAFYGENLTSKSDKLDWYTGYPLLESMDRIQKDKGLEDKPLRFPIQDVYKFDNRRIIAGRVETGTLRVGDEIFISPGNKKTRVKTIEHWAERDRRSEVSAGMSVGITVEDEFFNKRGEVITHPEETPITSREFKANIFWMGRNPLRKNTKYKLKIATQEVECEISSIIRAIDASTLEEIENSSEVKTNDVAEVIISTKEDIAFDEFKNNGLTGRFVIVEGYDVSGGGIVSGLVKGFNTSSYLEDAGRSIDISLFSDRYFAIWEGSLRTREIAPNVFGKGDVLPLTGVTYSYPENVDVFDVPGKSVARIRNSRLEGIVGLEDLADDGVQWIDSHGAGVEASGDGPRSSFLDELKALDPGDRGSLASFSNKWLSYFKHKGVKYIAQSRDIDIEYNI